MGDEGLRCLQPGYPPGVMVPPQKAPLIGNVAEGGGRWWWAGE